MKATSWKTLATAMVMVLGLSIQAQALDITPADAILSGNQTSNADILTFLASQGYDLNSLYKDNVGGVEEGDFAGSYDTTYFNEPLDPQDFLIVYTGGPVIGAPAYLLVKDGNAEPAWYFFDLTALGWTGTEDISGTGFWPDQGAVSHVEIFGERTTVPDGGSMAILLGMALVGLAGVRRYMA
jgi:hypothetical protein